MKDPLEDNLKSMRGPEMPPEVEARIRQRLSTEALRPPRSKRRGVAHKASYGQLLLLAVLMTVAAWVVVHEIVPVVKSTWERLCAPDHKAAPH